MQPKISDARIQTLQSVAVMKYKLGLSNVEIARRLNVSAMTISRFLDLAQEMGIIQISVKTSIEEDSELEKGLKERYNLKDCIVITGDIESEPIEATTVAAANYLDMILTDKDTFGLAAGRTIGKTISHMRLSSVSDTSKFTIVQLMGGSYFAEKSNPTTMISSFASRFGANGILLQQPLYTQTEEQSRLMRNAVWDNFMKRWQSCTVLAVGLGTVCPSVLQDNEGMLFDSDYREIVEKNAVGRIFGIWIGRDGNPIDCSCNRRAISIPMDIAMTIPLRVAISCGMEKIEVMRASLKSGLINCVITDMKTARYL
jgi:deoxyribonucleoside regulator